MHIVLGEGVDFISCDAPLCDSIMDADKYMDDNNWGQWFRRGAIRADYFCCDYCLDQIKRLPVPTGSGS